MTIFQVMTYAALLILSLGIIARIVRIARMPVHLRWELYPLPQERARARYGGSMMEEVDWWSRPHHPDRLGELRSMIQEILLLRGVWKYNRMLWLGSFPFHVGLYFLISELAVITLRAAMTITGWLSPTNEITLLASQALAWPGYALGAIGAAVLLTQRLTNAKLRAYNTPGHFLNLLLLGAIHVTGLFWLIADKNYAVVLINFLTGLVISANWPQIPALGYWHIGLVLVFFVYFPFTHMTHAFVKYFTYHEVRWDNKPNLPGSSMQTRIERQKRRTITWAAEHVNADGRKTWADLATRSDLERKQ